MYAQLVALCNLVIAFELKICYVNVTNKNNAKCTLCVLSEVR